MATEEEQIQEGYSAWLNLKDQYSYEYLMEDYEKPYVPKMYNNRATPPAIATEMLKDYYEAEEKPQTIDDWIWMSWSKRPSWFWIHLYYTAIETLMKEHMIEIYPDKTFSIIDPERAEHYIRLREENKRMLEERHKRWEEEEERKFQMFLSYHPEIADCLDENEQLKEEFSQMGRWLWVQGEAGRNKRLLENSIVLVSIYKKFGVGEHVGVNIVGKLIEYIREERKVIVRYLCNSLTTELPDYYIAEVLVDEKKKNIFLEE